MSTYPSYPPNPEGQYAPSNVNYNRFRPQEKEKSELFGCIPLRLMSLIVLFFYFKLCFGSLPLGMLFIFLTGHVALGVVLAIGSMLCLLGLMPTVFGIIKKSPKLVRYGPITASLTILWNICMIITGIVLLATTSTKVEASKSLTNKFMDENFMDNKIVINKFEDVSPIVGNIYLIMMLVLHFFSILLGSFFIFVFITLRKDFQRKEMLKQ